MSRIAKSIKPKTVELRFPAMGVVRRHTHEQVLRATEYASPWSVNARLEDEITGRLRGGSFTAIAAGDRPSECIYRDRLLTFSSNAITASRMGDHTDLAYSADVSDTLRPALFQLSEAGEVGEDVMALIPHKDAYLVCFTAGETWVQQGDPHTGPRRRISDEAGIIGANAWCVNHDTAYFLSSHGLYSVGADGSGFNPLSEGKIPEDLTGVDDDACTLTYNHADRSVYIHKSSGVSWSYGVERGDFWPFDDSGESHVLIGPIRIGSPNHRAVLQTIHGVIASGSGTVTWRIIPGDSAEEVCNNGKDAITAALAGSDFSEYYQTNGAWEAGRSNTGWPRVRAAWIVLWLCASNEWAYESVLLEVTAGGRMR